MSVEVQVAEAITSYDEGNIYSWIVCQFLNDEEVVNINSNRVGNVTNLVHGVFTKETEPPRTGWITFPSDETEGFADDKITVDVGYYQTVKGGVSLTHRMYTLTGSSTKELNGRYVGCGFHCGAPMYKVRKRKTYDKCVYDKCVYDKCVYDKCVYG